MIKRLRKKRAGPGEFLVPAQLPPLKGFDEHPELLPDGTRGLAARRPRTWLWTLVAALVVVSLLLYVIVLGAMGVYDGLKDRSLENRGVAQEHYALGLEYMAAQSYELAIAEFDLALRHDASLREARTLLREAKEMARLLVTPTSETRRGAADNLYREAVDYYEGGSLAEAIAVLDELRALDPEYQRDNVQTMLLTGHYRLGLEAVATDQMDQAGDHFERVLALSPGDSKAQDQLNLVHLYTAALSYWERDWSATIQALKGLYALAPDYKDVESRLHNAHIFYAQDAAAKGNWCRAAEQYASAVQIMPQESTVDARDDAHLRCEEAAKPPPATATTPPTARPQSAGTMVADATPPTTGTATATPASSLVAGSGLVAFAGFDAVRQQHDIYLVDLAQSNARLVQSNATQPTFDPSGKRLAFHSLHPQQLGLAVLDLRSGSLFEITAHAEDSSPTWSADAGQIVFASNKHGDRKWRLYVTSPGEMRGEGEEWVFGQAPAWSYDGSRIAYHGCDERGDRCGVWVMQPGGFNPAPLTSNASDTAPAWAPDGSQVAFVSSRAGNWEIYLVEIATGAERRLTENAAADVAPTWSPDGRRLAFLSNRDGAWAIYLLEVKSGQAQKLITTGDAYPDPVSERLAWIQ